jgi:hypothetical protein
MTKRQKALTEFRNHAGFISARDNAKDKGWNVLYRAEEQGIPSEDGGKYAIVCQAHGSVLQVNDLVGARSALRFPDFCDCCRGDCGRYTDCSSCGKKADQ